MNKHQLYEKNYVFYIVFRIWNTYKNKMHDNKSTKVEGDEMKFIFLNSCIIWYAQKVLELRIHNNSNKPRIIVEMFRATTKD